jgi:HAD superfamily hydrolase (TIGR01509 family)
MANGTGIRALIFDFDGTIVDSESPALHAWEEVFEQHGCAFPFEDWSVGLGSRGGFDSLAYLERTLGRAIDREAIRALRDRRKLEFTAACEVLPGVLDMLDAAERLGFPCAVASSSPRAWVVEHLERVGLIGRFRRLSCAEDVERVKPDPALYISALAALGVAPHEAVAIEDSPNGVAAARAAGIFCVAVPNSVTRRLAIAGADLTVDCLSEISLDAIVARAGAGADR